MMLKWRIATVPHRKYAKYAQTSQVQAIGSVISFPKMKILEGTTDVSCLVDV